MQKAKHGDTTVLGAIYHECEPDLKSFLDQHTSTDTVTLGCFREVNGTPEFIGMGWINTFQRMGGGHAKAEVGFGFFDGGSVFEKVRLVRMMVDWVFEHLDVDAIFGITPEPNRSAVAFIKRVGFDIVGPLPAYATWGGELCGAYVSCITKEHKRWAVGT